MESHEPDATAQENSSDAWSFIRDLDEGENWTERTRVVSKADHHFYTSCAQEFLKDLIDTLPVSQGSRQEMSDGGEGGVREDGEATQQRIEEFEYMNQFTDQDFQPQDALDIDYLESVPSSAGDSALTRQSLYVKFDPLVGGASPRSALKAAAPHLAPPTSNKTTPALSSLASARLNATLLDSSPSLPSHPPPSSSSSPSPSSLQTAPSASLHSHHPIPESSDLVNVLKYGDADVERAREEERLKMEMEMAKREAAMREEVARKESEAMKKVESVQRECEAFRCELAMNSADKAHLVEELKGFKSVIAAHEKTERELLDKYEDLKQSTTALEKERDIALKDFETLEKTFADLHQRYFKLKSVSQALQKNEEALKQCISKMEDRVRETDERYEALQKEVEDKLGEANLTFDAMKKEHASEMAVSKVTLKKYSMEVESLQKTVKQKEAEKQDLTQICDELMKELQQQQQ